MLFRFSVKAIMDLAALEAKIQQYATKSIYNKPPCVAICTQKDWL